MKKFPLLVALSLLISIGYAQVESVELNPQHSISLTLVSEGGANSGGVAYNPKFNLYYAVVSGNADFPLEVFKADGEPYYQTIAEFDLRGIWYNDEFNTIEGNSYEFHDIIEYLINDDDGVVFDPAAILWDLPIENTQSAACYNKADKVYVFLDLQSASIVEFDTEMGEFINEFPIDESINLDSINETSIICTGVEGAEYGIYDFESNQVLLINLKDGTLAAKIQLPDSSPKPEFLNFSFTNGHVWLFDVVEKTWHGYKVIKS